MFRGSAESLPRKNNLINLLYYPIASPLWWGFFTAIKKGEPLARLRNLFELRSIISRKSFCLLNLNQNELQEYKRQFPILKS